MIRLTDAFRWFTVFLGAGVLIAGCASKPVIRADYDHNADFGSYHSFGFFEKLAADEQYESLSTQYIKAAVKREMESRGYRFLDKDPDLLINFNVKIEEKQQIRTAAYPAGYYGYRWGYYGAWGGYTYDTYTYEYSEGTLNIDIVDRTRKQMVWEGVAIGKVREKDFENVRQAVDNAVNLIFRKFPFRDSPYVSKPD